MPRAASGTAVELRLVEGSSEPSAQLPDFEQLYREHAEYVATVAYRLLGRRQDVDDIVHDVFLQANKSLSSLRDAGAVRSWLATITVRVARRSMRRSGLRRLLRRSLDDPDELSASQLGPEGYALVHSVYAALERLPADQRIAWALRRVHRARLEAVAQMCGCSLATAKRRIAAADKALKGGSTP